MADDSIRAITDSLPPTTDYLTYLTIIESHLSPEILPTLNNVLQDATLTQNIGWDLIQLLLPFKDADQCLATIARLGNPKEVVLKVTEALNTLDPDSDDEVEEGVQSAEPTAIEKFCTLLSLLSELHPRIKTKYPSRFLSTTLMAILSAFRPSNQATLAVITFVHTISGKKRPSLPGRKSSLQIPALQVSSGTSAPDPEPQDADPNEAVIQTKLLQSFMTHVLEEYANANTLEWAARLQESFEPGKVVSGRTSLGEAYRDDPALQIRDTIVGQLVALCRDLGLSNYDILLDAIHNIDQTSSDDEDAENYPSEPADIPLSRGGCLFLIASFVFASVLFGSKQAVPSLSMFPDHARLVKMFIGREGPGSIGTENIGVIDAILALGLWLEHSNLFVSGPLEDEEYLQQLQSLSLISANTPAPTMRYVAHVLTSALIHAHPVDRLRLTFISDTLENCPYDTLKASAVAWLKEEIIAAKERKSKNVFSSTVALAAAQPYLFPDTSVLSETTDDELKEAMAQEFPFHMAVVNFLYFIGGKQYEHVVPTGMTAVVEEIYLGPLRKAQEKCLGLWRGQDMEGEMELLGERIKLSLEQIDAT